MKKKIFFPYASAGRLFFFGIFLRVLFLLFIPANSRPSEPGYDKEGRGGGTEPAVPSLPKMGGKEKGEEPPPPPSKAETMGSAVATAAAATVF